MSKRKPPKVTFTKNEVQPPQYTKEEIEGLKLESTRLTQHITILEEEVKNKRAQLVGIKKIILDQKNNS